MSSPITSALKSTTFARAIAQPAPAPCYIFPETLGKPGTGGGSRLNSADALVFQYWPESLEDSYQVEYGTKQSFGATHPLFQWTGGSGRDITFTARFTSELESIYDGVSATGLSASDRYTVDCRAALDYLRAGMLPSYGNGNDLNTLAAPPSRFFLVMEGTRLGGQDKDWVLCLLRSAPITYEAWFPSGRPRIVEAALTFSECVQFSAGEGQAQIEFEDRGNRQTHGKNYHYRGAIDRV